MLESKVVIQDVLALINREIANIFEIVDGGWGYFPTDCWEEKNQISSILVQIVKNAGQNSSDIKAYGAPDHKMLLNITGGVKEYLLLFQRKLEGIKTAIQKLEDSEIKENFKMGIERVFDIFDIVQQKTQGTT